MSRYDPEPDNFLRNFLIFLVVLFTVFIVFMVTVVSPSHAERRESCAAKGGVVVNDGSCIDKRYVL